MTKEQQKQALTQLRSQLVGSMHVQPFTIYNDATINELVKAQPKTLSELARVKGFPVTGKRIKGFGDAIIAIFNEQASGVKTKIIMKNGDAEVQYTMEKLSVF